MELVPRTDIQDLVNIIKQKLLKVPDTVDEEFLKDLLSQIQLMKQSVQIEQILQRVMDTQNTIFIYIFYYINKKEIAEMIEGQIGNYEILNFLQQENSQYKITEQYENQHNLQAYRLGMQLFLLISNQKQELQQMKSDNRYGFWKNFVKKVYNFDKLKYLVRLDELSARVVQSYMSKSKIYIPECKTCKELLSQTFNEQVAKFLFFTADQLQQISSVREKFWNKKLKQLFHSFLIVSNMNEELQNVSKGILENLIRLLSWKKIVKLTVQHEQCELCQQSWREIKGDFSKNSLILFLNKLDAFERRSKLL